VNRDYAAGLRDAVREIGDVHRRVVDFHAPVDLWRVESPAHGGVRENGAGSVEVATEFRTRARSRRPLTRRSNALFRSIGSLPAMPISDGPSYQAGALHRDDGVGHGGHQGPELWRVSAGGGRPASGAGPISNFEMRNSAFISCGLSAGTIDAKLALRRTPRTARRHWQAAGSIHTRNRARSRWKGDRGAAG